MRVGRAVVFLAAIAACGPGSGAPKPAKPKLAPSGPKLPPPLPVDAHARGASYLATLGNQIQPRWGQFLEDCRLRLSPDHPLNAPALVASVELVVDETGALVERTLVNGSGNGDFDHAVDEVLREVVPGVPPAELASDDGRVHLRWLFARDRRQAGPATAQVILIDLPLLATVQRILTHDDATVLARAASRILRAPPADLAREDAIDVLMIAALREGLARSDGVTREAALDAVTSVAERVSSPPGPLTPLVVDVRRLIGTTNQLSLRVKAITASAALRDAAAAPTLREELPADFEERPDVALAKVAALAALGHSDDAAHAVRTAADSKNRRAITTALAALAIVPDGTLGNELDRRFTSGNAEVRQAICQALPAGAPTPIHALALLGRGLRDPDASVRATCASAGMHLTPTRAPADRALVARLVELARDRDEIVRARAIATLGILDPGARGRIGIDDRAPQVRAAAAAGAALADLRTLSHDKDPDVRAAALTALASSSSSSDDTTLALAVTDPAAQVRRAAVAILSDDTLLDRLAADSDPDVATAALSRYAAHRGRAAIAGELLERLVAATPKSLERVRIARAWLLAR